MIVKNFKLFELNTFKNLKDDINGILVELNDMGYTVRTYGLYDDGSLSGGDTFSFKISKGSHEGQIMYNYNNNSFLITDIKVYLDTCIDYMNLYYKYKTEVNYILMYSNKEINITYKDLKRLEISKFRVSGLILIFTDISKK